MQQLLIQSLAPFAVAVLLKPKKASESPGELIETQTWAPALENQIQQV